MLVCPVCGASEFRDQAVIWDALATEWQLSPDERRYIDRQQGTLCTNCHSNLRSLALAEAIRAALGTELPLSEFIRSQHTAGLQVLEINEAGTVRPQLRHLPGHVMADYPIVDMHALPYADASFDIVLHSDTLEHVPNPIHALRECRRVLRPGGAVCFTVPTIIGRLSRSREGLPMSYHGDPSREACDFIVQTEFGADAWTYPVQAGFNSITIHTFDYPAGIAIRARR